MISNEGLGISLSPGVDGGFFCVAINLSDPPPTPKVL